jgi:hypothetical protein
MVNKEDGQKSHGRTGKTGGKFVLAEDRERKGAKPVVQGWFIKKLDIIEHGGDEVAALQHLARYLRIAALVGVDEGNPPQELEKGDSEDEQEEGKVLFSGVFPIGEEIGKNTHGAVFLFM